MNIFCKEVKLKKTHPRLVDDQHNQVYDITYNGTTIPAFVWLDHALAAERLNEFSCYPISLEFETFSVKGKICFKPRGDQEERLIRGNSSFYGYLLVLTPSNFHQFLKLWE
jgi:hypothetical protein